MYALQARDVNTDIKSKNASSMCHVRYRNVVFLQQEN